MATQVRDKYFLRTLHEEIGLFDRKLAHLLKYENFASDKERDLAVGKLSTKREQLVRTAKLMAEQGIEFKNSELPRSLRNGEPEPEHIQAPVAEPAPQALARPLDRPALSAHDGTILDFRNEIKEYIEKRRKSLVLTPEA